MLRRPSTLPAVALALAAALAAPAAAAPDGPDPTENKKIEKTADREAVVFLRALAKSLRPCSADAKARLKEFGSAVREGRNVEVLSGIPSTPDVRVSEAQMAALFEKSLGVLMEYLDGALGKLGDAYTAYAGNPKFQAVEGAGVHRRQLGTDGSRDRVADGASDALDADFAGVMTEFRRFQDALRDAGFLTNVSTASVPVDPPTAGSPTGRVLRDSAIALVAGDCRGNAYAGVALADPATELGTTGAKVVSPQGDVPHTQVETFQQMVFFRSFDVSSSGGDRIEGDLATILFDTASGEPRSAAPLTTTLGRIDPAGSFGPTLDLAQGGGTTSLFVQPFPSGGKSHHSVRAFTLRNVLPEVDILQTLTGVITGAQAGERPFDLADFPAGAGPNGFTVFPVNSIADPGGDWLVTAIKLGSDVDLDDPERRFQFGFVFDQDTSTANNYFPTGTFSGDYFRGSDKWYYLETSPGNPPRFNVTDARSGSFMAVPSAARIVVNGKVILLGVPRSEFAVPRPAYRCTSFVHFGNFGIPDGEFWSADYTSDALDPLGLFRTE